MQTLLTNIIYNGLILNNFIHFLYRIFHNLMIVQQSNDKYLEWEKNRKFHWLWDLNSFTQRAWGV